MLGRCERAEDVFITGPFDLGGIKCNETARRMVNILDKRSNAEKTPAHEEGLKIVLLNTRSFNKHKEDILKDHTIQIADVIFLTETWLAGGQCQENPFPLHTFAAYASYGKGKGCATFSRTAFQAFSVVKKEFQLMSVCTSGLKFLLVYNSPEAPILSCLSTLRKTQELGEKSVVLGDFNTSANNVYLKEFALQNNLKQLVSLPTHDKGNILDHLYVSFDLANNVSHSHHCLYFSDHDCLAMTIQT